MKYFILIPLLLLSATLAGSDHYPTNTGIDVRAYVFTIRLTDNNDIIKGEAEIRLLHNRKTSNLFFDLADQDEDGKGMTVEEVFADDKMVEWEHSDNRIYIDLPYEKNDGESSRVVIKYSGTPRDGLIISKNRFGDRTFFADNWPDRARNWIPCVDHPSDKARVEFKVYAPDHYQVVSNGIKVEETVFSEGLKLTHWREEVSIPTKVMVIGVARFATQLLKTVGGIDIWTYVFPEDRNNGFSDYSIAVDPFEFYSTTIGSYPYEKLANVQSKTIFGGMENAGCIFYSERSVSGKNEIEGLVAHEIAHQWFGNSVTELDWHHIWLSEGFATYFTSYYLEKQYGESKMKSLMQHSRNRVIRSYERNPSPVIDTTITNFMRLLNTNSYQKGAWVLHMLRDELGDDRFITGIRTYYNRFRNQNALTSDFKTAMEDISETDLEKFFEQWLIRPELPVLQISWEYNSRKNETTVSLSQEQESYLFDIPVEIEIVETSGHSSIMQLRLSKKATMIVVETDSSPKEIILDPNTKLLFIESALTRD